MTILVVNNHGGAIFSLLPLADKVEPSILHQYFYTSHNILIQGLCVAHGIKHLHVKTKAEFEDALRLAQHEQVDCMVEIDSSIDANANFHSILRKHSLLAVKDAMRYLPNGGAIKDEHYLYKIRRMNCLRYRIALSAPPTSAFVGDNHEEFYKEGFIISLILEDGSVGFGEVAPIEIHRENLVDAEYQLRFLVHIMQEVNISCFLSLLKGTFSYWIWNELGIVVSCLTYIMDLWLDILYGSKRNPLDYLGDRFADMVLRLFVKGSCLRISGSPGDKVSKALSAIKLKFKKNYFIGNENYGSSEDLDICWCVWPSSIFPSVRCGLEMAILNAIAAAKGSNLLTLLHPLISEKDRCETSSVQVCALLDSNGSPTDVANVAATLVEEGFSAIKLKVARRNNPMQDAMVIKEVRKKVGCQIILRADANQKWTYEEAIEFSSLVKDCNLQFIEEPVNDEDDIVKFCEESGLPVALDETVDKIQENPLEKLVKFTHPGIVAVVIKPSVVGGFENAALIGRWAHQLGKMAVVSAAFESSLSLSAYAQFSSYLEMLSFDTMNKLHDKEVPSVAHGLGTYRWLKEDVTSNPLLIGCNPHSGFVEASVANASRLLQYFEVNQNVICDIIDEERVLKYQLKVELSSLSCSFEVQETGQKTNDNVLVFLHGFLGAGEDWSPIMKSFSGSARCISVDLPGHGKSIIHGVNDACEEPCLSMEIIADIFHQLLHQITPAKVTLVGYSMGARIALYLALRFSSKIKGAVLISGSPGLKDKLSRKIRAAKDDSRASSIISHGLESFLNSWYEGDLWKSLRSHPNFTRITANRSQHEDLQSLSKMLSGLSIGRQPSLWEDLPNCKTPLLIMHGEKDAKFKKIAQEIMNTVRSGVGSNQEKVNIDIHEVVEIPNCGHAAHLENPLPVVSAFRRFLTTL
ncbi:hypothetical protein PIB30_040017 [Stylosanthes scabra]|uniref:Mandelate racemase/muconate lactonizing enzyme C-terminal domain-containing protein n=1 Tax=Stylosanthes scabra TaxID=79078 RepID=A0ABU6QE30_9FABA|nr:hypothetical protein [Stylosanthes scabra]